MRVKPLYYFAIDEALIEDAHPRHLLDMLRYDQAKVVGSEFGFWFFSAEREPTVSRWQSFGIVPNAIIGVERSTEPYAIRDAARCYRDRARKELRS